jgi:8-oxo-dGTP pyrophosphatase MutT (NUDIX family)
VYPGYTTVPGGGVDEGETKQDAIIRETLEEVGIDIRAYENATVRLVNDTMSGDSEKVLRTTGERVLVHMHFIDFLVTIPRPASAIPVKADDDFTDAAWVLIADLPTLRLTEPTRGNTTKTRILLKSTCPSSLSRGNVLL